MSEKKYKIVYDREGCIGAGTCVSACPDNWKMADDNKADFKKEEITESELEDNLEAANVCPVDVIKIVDEEGNEVTE